MTLSRTLASLAVGLAALSAASGVAAQSSAPAPSQRAAPTPSPDPATPAPVGITGDDTVPAAQFLNGAEARPSDPARIGITGDDTVPAAQFLTRLDADLSAGLVSRSSAVQLRRVLDSLVRLQTRYAADGLSADENADLARRFAELQRQATRARR